VDERTIVKEEFDMRDWPVKIIKKDGRWVVETPKGRPERGIDRIEWTLIPDPDGHEVSAHFQFTDRKLFDNADSVKKPLTQDLTAVIPEAGGTLKLKVHAQAFRRKDENPHYYAVWIEDKCHAGKGMFAVGESLNPPPEVNVGP